VADVGLTVVEPGSAAARTAMSRYFTELAERFPEGFDADTAMCRALTDLAPPDGVFVIAGDRADPAGCGALHYLDEKRAEVKRMWVAPEHRRRGIASALLTELEELARQAGRTTVVLDTHEVLLEAVALYRASGYQPVPSYNDNPNAAHWFAKQLPPSGGTA
jgi:GNAT superfamily N-acetyltransferase